MARLLDRLCQLAETRDDVVLVKTSDIGSWGFLLFKDGKYHIYLNETIRDFRKSMILVQLLGDYAHRRLCARKGLEGTASGSVREVIVLEKARDNWIVTFSKRLLWRVRLGLHGKASSRPAGRGATRGAARGGRRAS